MLRLITSFGSRSALNLHVRLTFLNASQKYDENFKKVGRELYPMQRTSIQAITQP